MNKRLTLLGLSLLTTLHLHAVENMMMTFKYGLTDLDGSLSLNKNTFGFDLTLDTAGNLKPKFDFTYLSVDESGNGVDYTLQFAVNALYEGSEVYYDSILPYAYAGIGYEYVNNDRPAFESAPYVQFAGGLEFPFFGYENDDYKIVTEARWMQMIASSGGQDSEVALFIGFRISTGALSSGYRGTLASYDYEGNANYVELEEDDLPKNAPELVKEHIVFSDADGDGVADKDDQCPHTPRGTVVDIKGCPIGRSPWKKGTYHPPAKVEKKRVTFQPLPKRREVLQIKFDSNSANITSESRKKIRKLVERLNRRGYKYITIEGYTDNSGLPSQNLQLSQKRAESVKSLMVQYGIDSERITAVGKGELNPIADNDVPEGRALNRRIEIVIE